MKTPNALPCGCSRNAKHLCGEAKFLFWKMIQASVDMTANASDEKARHEYEAAEAAYNAHFKQPEAA